MEQHEDGRPSRLRAGTRWLTSAAGGATEDAARRETYQGFGNALATAFELVMTPLIFGFAGHLLDGWVGSGSLFTVIFALLAIVGLSARMWYGYEAKMKLHEASAPWAGSTRKQSFLVEFEGAPVGRQSPLSPRPEPSPAAGEGASGAEDRPPATQNPPSEVR